MGLELLSGLLDRCALLLEPAFVGSEGFLHLNDPALPLREVPCLGLQVLGIPLKIGVHLMDSLGLSHPILLHLGGPRSLESISRARCSTSLFKRSASSFNNEADRDASWAAFSRRVTSSSFCATHSTSW